MIILTILLFVYVDFVCDTTRLEQLYSFNKRAFPELKATKIILEKSSVSRFSVCTWIHFRIFWQLQFGKQSHFLKWVVYFVGTELSYKWQTYTCLSFPYFCFVIDKKTHIGLNMSYKIYMVNWTPIFFSKIRVSICHYSKCHIPFGVGSHHFTLDLVSILPSLMQSIIIQTKRRKKGREAPSHYHEVFLMG